jgi:hypothetical protein
MESLIPLHINTKNFILKNFYTTNEQKINVEEVLIRIKKLKQEVEKHSPLQPEQKEGQLQKIRIDWSFHSNHIESNSLTMERQKHLFDQHIIFLGQRQIESFELWLRAVKDEKIEEEIDGDALMDNSIV